MKTTKTTFHHRIEWSDWSENSPQHHGALPDAMILPSGKELPCSSDDLMLLSAERMGIRTPRDGYMPFPGGEAKFRSNSWGDDGSRRQGRAGTDLEIFAPIGTRFLFAHNCYVCGEEVVRDESPKSREEFHPACRAQYDSEIAAMEEARAELEAEGIL